MSHTTQYDDEIAITAEAVEAPLFDLISDGESLYIDGYFDEREG